MLYSEPDQPSDLDEARIPEEDVLEIAEITLRNMARLKRADGGFSREIDHPPAPNVAQVKQGEYYPDMPEAVPLGKGEIEGDMNAGTQAILIRYTHELGARDESWILRILCSHLYEQVRVDDL